MRDFLIHILNTLAVDYKIRFEKKTFKLCKKYEKLPAL